MDNDGALVAAIHRRLVARQRLALAGAVNTAGKSKEERAAIDAAYADAEAEYVAADSFLREVRAAATQPTMAPSPAALSRVLTAVREAQGVVADYISPSSVNPSPFAALSRLLAILDDGDLNEAMEKLESGRD